MQAPPRRIVVAASRLFLVLALERPVDARADWPTGRHDARRTATGSSAPSNITRPAAIWRHYLGGIVENGAIVAVDVDRDGAEDFVHVAGGKVIAKRASDALLWETPALSVKRLSGLADLDGDGKPEVIAWGRKVYALDLATGAIAWEEPEGEMVNVNAVRVADLDGDGGLELVIEECHCCDVTANRPNLVWTFKTGYGGARLAWAGPNRDRCFGWGTTVGDFDGDKRLDLAVLSTTSILFLRGSDGQLLGRIDGLGNGRADRATCDAVDLDGVPGDELVCFLGDYWPGDDSGGRMVWATGFDAQRGGHLIWSHEYPRVAAGQLTNGTLSQLHDFDGDARFEVAYGDYDGVAWTTHVLDGATGAELATRRGCQPIGRLDLDGDGRSELLGHEGDGVIALDFKRGAALLPRFSVPDLRWRTAFEWQVDQRSGCNARAVAIDLDGDKLRDPIVLLPTALGRHAELRGIKAHLRSPPTTLATLVIDDGISLFSMLTAGSITRPGPQLVVLRNDGFLVVLDNRLQPTTATADGEFPLPGMRLGGWYTGPYGYGAVPIAANLGDASDSVIASTSRNAIVRLDAREASQLSPPRLAWERRETRSPVIARGIDGGRPGVGGFDTSVDSDPRVVALSAGGTTLWSTQVEARINQDLLPGDANGDGVDDLFMALRDRSNFASLQVHDGKTGAALWPTPVRQGLSSSLNAFALADWNGDGTDDLWGVLEEARVIDGRDGRELLRVGVGPFPSTILDDTDGDGVLDFVFHGGIEVSKVYDKNLSRVSWAGTDRGSSPFGVVVHCPGAVRFAQAALQSPGVVSISTLSGAGGVDRFALAGGQRFGDVAAALAAGRRPGVVGNATVKPDLMGPGTHPSVLFGSTDGFLYAVDACTGQLDFSHEFRYPVGEAVFADTTGDGRDEILVTVADGFLYALAQEILPAPAPVIDTDGAAGDDDVDRIATTSALWASWPAVPGAEAYEVAIVTGNGTYITQPEWQNVGAVTRTERGSLPLVEGRRYHVAVRALSSKGGSVESISDGVVVHLAERAPPDLAMDAAEPPSRVEAGCGCRVGARVEGRAGAPGRAAVALLALALATRRRRRARASCSCAASRRGWR